ncbi:MAG: PaaI family thioesterase [Planctomycetota bacterium]|nr:MAG: PaaI family thioesterase [Planctomycetota bacterium]
MKDKSNNLAQQFIDAYENGAFPFLHAVHMEPVEIGDGKGSLKIVLNDSHLRVGAIMHGGVASALLDTALGLAAATRAPKQHDVVTAQMNINFIKAARIGEELIGEGTILHSGRRTCVAEGRIHNQTGELIAAGSGTLLYVPMPSEDAEMLIALGERKEGGEA